MKSKLLIAVLILSAINAGSFAQTPAQKSAQQRVQTLEAAQQDLLKEQESLLAQKELYRRALRDITEFQKLETVEARLQSFQTKALQFQATQQAAIKALDTANQAAEAAKKNEEQKTKDKK